MKTALNGEFSSAEDWHSTVAIVADMNSRSHVQSESHVRQVLLIGEDPKRHIEDFSRLFLNNFLNLLKTTHGEKKVHINQFYQQVIADKEVS